MIVTSQGLLLAARHDFGAFKSCLKMCNFQQFISQVNMRFKNPGKKIYYKTTHYLSIAAIITKTFFS